MRLTPEEIDADQLIEFLLENGAETGDLTLGGSNIEQVGYLELNPKDVRNISSPSEGFISYHDGSGSNTQGPAHFNGTDWISTVDGSTIN